MKRKRTPKEIVWRVMVYGPATVMLLLSLGLLAINGWSEGWVGSVAYAVAAANMWIVSRQLLTNYRAGYWQGRLELILERMGVQPERGPGDDPGPWEDPMSEAQMAKLMREAAERGNLRRDPDEGA